ncbi:MAG: hypothetical protein LQ346_004939 [Caloplaca aetnensis]|nr:MAG: hypothetical protein LQ346_004939 [Caloplaca aetnensis]
MPQLLTDWSYASLIRLRNADYEAVLGCNKSKPKPKPKAAVGFFDLPAEVRNQIYGYLVSPNLPDVSKGPSPVGSIAASTEWDINIMFVNLQAYREASYVFYRDHLFVRVQIVTSDGIMESIRTLGFDKLIRTGAQYCPRINITLDVFTPRRNDGFLDMIFAYQDIGKIGSLLLWTVQQWWLALYNNLEVIFEVRLTICEPPVARPVSFSERVLQPLFGIPGVEFAPPDYDALEELFSISKESSRIRCKDYAAFKRHLAQLMDHQTFSMWKAVRTGIQALNLDLDLDLVDHLLRSHFVLAETLESQGQLWLADHSLELALSLIDFLIQVGCAETSSPKAIRLLQRGIELVTYDLSCHARDGAGDSGYYRRRVEKLSEYCLALSLACGSERIKRFYKTIETFILYAGECGKFGLRWSRYWTYFGDEIVEVVSWDPNNELGLNLFHLLHEFRQRLAIAPHDRLWFEDQ